MSRLLCPRRLDPSTDYLACLVPAFELGRKAGLGLPIAARRRETAETGVDLGAQSPSARDPARLLPVGVSDGRRRRFRGAGATRSKPQARCPPRSASGRWTSAGPASSSTPPLPPGTCVELEGALRAFDGDPADVAAADADPLPGRAQGILNAPWQAKPSPATTRCSGRRSTGAGRRHSTRWTSFPIRRRRPRRRRAGCTS